MGTAEYRVHICAVTAVSCCRATGEMISATLWVPLLTCTAVVRELPALGSSRARLPIRKYAHSVLQGEALGAAQG